MVFQKRTCLLVLFLLALVSAIAFQIIHISKWYITLPLLVAGLVYLIYKPDELGANQEALLAWEENNLSSDVGFDYTRLRDLLAAGNWKEADYETITVMLQATGREVSYEFIQSLPLAMFIKYFPYPEFIENCPCSALRTIDQLWVKYSNGRFGFSVQKRIWDSVGHNSKKFGDRVGWTKGWWMKKHWIWSDELTFDTSAPVGHLPFELGWVMELSWVSEICGCLFPAERAVWERAHALQVRFAVFSRIQACKSPSIAINPPQHVSIPNIPSSHPDNLSSDAGVDYTRLRDLLAAGNWFDADYETYLVMLLVVGREENDWIRDKELLNFPCTDLRTIDSLWVKYSNGRFGFSVQKKIYLEVGGIPDGKFYEEAWDKFGDAIGWRVNQTWIDYNEVTFNTIKPLTPEGHLPVLVGCFQLCGWCLFSRIQTCKL